MLKRFQQEAQATSTLNHPNILTVYDFGLTEDGQPYLVMDFLEGTSLGELLQEEGNLPLERCLPIFVQTAAGLAQAHSKGIIHRDLKPSNIMLVELDGNPDFVKIVDFGIAKMLSSVEGEGESLTRTGEVFGSPMYMSPEQCRGQQLDFRSDIYSLGCVMYRTATGMSPFLGHDQLECMYKQVNEVPLSFSEACPDLFLPEEFEAVVFKSLAKSAEDRYQSMAELRQALDRLPQSGKAGLHLTGHQRSEPEATPVALKSTEQSSQLAPEKTSGSSSDIGKSDSARTPIVVGFSSGGADVNSADSKQELIEVSYTTAPNKGLTPASKRLLIRLAVGFTLGVIGAAAALQFTQHKETPTQKSTASQQLATSSQTTAAPGKSALELKMDGELTQAHDSFNKGNFDDAERHALQASNTAKVLPNGDKQYAQCLNFLGSIYYMQGQYGEASTYLQKAMSLRQKAFGDKSAEVAETKTLLGRTWSALGQYSKAEIVLDQALTARTAIFGNNDLLVADTLSALADVDLRQRKFAAAETKLSRALDIRQIVQGKDSLDAATAMNDLAQAYQLERKFDKAMTLYSSALKIRQAKLPANSPLIADSYICIGALCAQTGQVAQAKTLYQSALTIEEKSLDPSSPRIASTRKRLADLSRQPKAKGQRAKSFSSLLAR